jgi:hypothetical protein
MGSEGMRITATCKPLANWRITVSGKLHERGREAVGGCDGKLIILV